MISILYFYIFFILILQQVIQEVSQQLNKYKNHTPHLYKNTYYATEILINKKKVFHFFNFMLCIFVIDLYYWSSFAFSVNEARSYFGLLSSFNLRDSFLPCVYFSPSKCEFFVKLAKLLFENNFNSSVAIRWLHKVNHFHCLPYFIWHSWA